MNRYSKPSASIELFCLDGEFAGGCNKIEKPIWSALESFVNAGVDGLFEEYRRMNLPEGDPQKISQSGAMNINQVIDLNEDIADFSVLKGLLDSNDRTALRGAWENATLIAEVRGNGGSMTDNLSSGHCYFTFTAPLNKTFS